MGLIDRLFGNARPAPYGALYDGIIAQARARHWYVEGQVPDTIDGRFDMVAAILALVLIRLERDPAAVAASAQLTERFITDMDAQLRESGIGDVGIGKHVGNMMSMLGGRVGAYRGGLAQGDLAAAIERNIYRGTAPGGAALAHAAARLRSFWALLDTIGTDALLAGALS